MVQEVASKCLGTIPSTITAAIGSLDSNIQQIIQFLNEEGRQAAGRHSWQALTKEATFNTLATEVQGSVLTICGADFNFVVNETIWDRTTRRPVYGPRSPSEWQLLKAQPNQGPFYQYRLRGNQILFIPAPPVNDAIYFEWVTKFWCTDVSGVTGRTAMTVDTDVSKLDEDLHILGGIWRFKQAKGLPWDDFHEKYERMFADLTSRDGIKARLNLAGSGGSMQPGLLVPAGSWPISGNP